MQLFDFIHRHFGEHPELIHLLSGENLLRARAFLAPVGQGAHRDVAAHRSDRGGCCAGGEARRG